MSPGNARILCDASMIHADPHEGTVANVPLPSFLINNTNCKVRFYSLFFKHCEGKNSNWCQKQKSKTEKGLHQLAHQRSIGTWWAKWWSRKCINDQINQSIDSGELPVVSWHGTFFKTFEGYSVLCTLVTSTIFFGGFFSMETSESGIVDLLPSSCLFQKQAAALFTSCANAVPSLASYFSSLWLQESLNDMNPGLPFVLMLLRTIRKFFILLLRSVEESSTCNVPSLWSAAKRGQLYRARQGEKTIFAECREENEQASETEFKNGAKDVGNYIGESCGVVLASPESRGKKLPFLPRQSSSQSTPITVLSATNQSINQSINRLHQRLSFLLPWFNRILKLF